MSRRRLLALFAIAIVLLLPLLLPLRLVLGLAGDGLPLGARDVSGSIWNGRLRGAHWGAIPLDDASLRLKPLPLLVGQQQWLLDSGRLRATLVHGRTSGLRDAGGELDLGDLAWPGSRLRLGLVDATLLFRGDRCETATGTLSLELMPPAANGDSEAQSLRLDGRLACDGRGGYAELAPTGSLPAGIDAAVVRLRLAPDGLLTADAEIRSDEPALRLALQMAGFEDAGDSLQHTVHGCLAGC